MKKLLLLAAVFFALTNTSQAKDWTVDYAHSKLGFTGVTGSTPFQGEFKKFTAQISLDPDHPETGKIAAVIDIASAAAGAPDRDEMLPEKEWFDTSKFPQAQFTTTAIRKLSSGHYEADASLTIKGVTQKLILPFTLMPEENHWRAHGHVTLMRTDFTIGTGSYENENYVKHAVDVNVDLVAQ